MGELVAALTGGEVLLPPIRINGSYRGSDRCLVAEVSWGGKDHLFRVVCEPQWTPKAVREAANEARRLASGDERPMVLAPYLSEARLDELEAGGVSGVDLCGNGAITVPGELLVRRVGSPSRFRHEAAIKNVYRGDSSLAARVFLLRPRYNSVQEAAVAIRERGGRLALGTVSKVARALVEDLVIEKKRAARGGSSALALLQPDKLLDQLAANFQPQGVATSYRGKMTLAPEAALEALATWERETGERVARTGAGSADAYAVMAREPVLACYCTDIASLLASLGAHVRETEAFANLHLIQTSDQAAYFDRRAGLAASPIQAYLELMAGDKRERETAEQVRRAILQPLAHDTGV